MPPVTPSKQKNAMSLPLRSQTVMDKTRPGTQENNASRKSRSASEPSVFINGSRPPRTPSAKRRKFSRKKSLVSVSISEQETEEEDLPPPPKPAWDQFAEHIKTFAVAGTSYSSASTPEQHKHMDKLFDGSGSDICKKILKDMKDQLERKRVKELAALQRQREAEESAAAICDVPSSDEDSDLESESGDEEEKKAKNLKLEAQRYWGIIRRSVQEKIRIRKEKNPAGGTWNNLRAQLRALTRGNNVRQELYEKYGVVPKPGCKTTEDTMKPALSIDIREVINRFQSLQVRKLKVTFA